jgi:hypothetical protein
MNIVGHQGLTVTDLIASLSALPGDLLVLIEADGATEHLMLIADSRAMSTPTTWSEGSARAVESMSAASSVDAVPMSLPSLAVRMRAPHSPQKR